MLAIFLPSRYDLLMKLVIAIIQPNKLEDVKNALTEHGIHGMTVTDNRFDFLHSRAPRRTMRPDNVLDAGSAGERRSAARFVF